MAKMSIYNPDILKLLPQFMRNDQANIALAKAVNALIAVPAQKSKILKKWNQFDNMDHEQLNEMAWEFNIDWWDSSLPLDRKRAIIKTCYRVHEKRGTKWAVEELITSVFGMGKVIEWFEYGGQPFYFKIITNATLTEDGMKFFLNMIDKVKNARSHVELIEVNRSIKQSMHAGTAQSSSNKCVILDHFAETRQAAINPHAGTGNGAYHAKQRIYDHFALNYSANVLANVGSGKQINHIKNTIKED